MHTHLTKDEASILRHACAACGGSCQGVIVSLLGSEEQDRVAALGAALEVDTPLIDGRLRLEDGHCVFLGDSNRCRIHERFGLEAKPTVCKQFPMVAVRANDELRVGIDPACYSAYATEKTAPEVVSGGLVATSSALVEQQAVFEEMLLRLCEADGVSVSTLASWLVGQDMTADGGLPDGFENRLVQRARSAGLADWLRENPVGRAIRSSLLPALELAERGGAGRWSELEDGANSWAVESIRRVLFLRLTGEIPSVPGAALLLVAGAVLCGRAHPDADGFARSYAGWLRAIRFRQFWILFTPDSATMTSLIRG